MKRSRSDADVSSEFHGGEDSDLGADNQAAGEMQRWERGRPPRKTAKPLGIALD
jgi:hypothetical protein